MIRKVSLQDAQAIADIYNDYVVNSVITFDTEPVSVAEMRTRIAEISSRYPYWVYEDCQGVAGFCYAHAWKSKEAYWHTLETTIYLSSSHQGKGIGRQLMLRLIDDCRRLGHRALVACITAGNEASISFHLKLGFSQVSHFKGVGMKFGRMLDVLDYELML